MRTIIIIIFFVFVLFLSSTVINVPEDQPTIQEGINVAVDGDTVLVADGYYTGVFNRELTWDGNEKHIVVKSENGYENCFIDCQQSGRAFTFYDTNQDSTDVIEGFHISNGYVFYDTFGGGAICCYNASPKILNNRISNNVADECSGGGIFLFNSDSKIIGNSILNNTSDYSYFPGGVSGGGIYIFNGSSIIKDNIIMNNQVSYTDIESDARGGGIYAATSYYYPLAQIQIINNLIISNSAYSSWNGTTGGGIYINCYYDGSQIINNTVIGNHATVGSGIYCRRGQVSQNIIVDNSQEGLRCFWPNSTAIINHNNVQDNGQNYVNCPTGIGDTSWGFNINNTACDSCFNICEDPLFVSSLGEEYFLSQFEAGQNYQSSCVDAGFGSP
ncbi:MAG: hypothetical protein Q7J16_02315, partial [Candidatus Cloacimonadales bacterium]|nr:hypothetical protein [Candidatus Cloacimonadales bacterium]